MSGLTVGGTTIPVAWSGLKRDRSDWVDRARAFDGTYRASSTGGAVREWGFQTPPVTRTLADTYEALLSQVAAQTCSGDILALPTMCCTEITGWTPVTTAQGHSVVIDFVLHEVQPAKMLLRYSPGDTIASESFSRASSAYYTNSAGTMVSVGNDVKRDSDYPQGTRGTLLEGSHTNSLLFANDFSNAVWVGTFCGVTTGIADPAGGTSACTLTGAASNAGVEQHISDGASIVRTGSVWLKRRTGSGPIQLRVTGAGAYTTVPVTSSWTRFSVTGAASISRQFNIQLATSGDAVDAWCAQLDDSSFPSSEIPTTAAAVTRALDSYSIPFTTTPQEMTVYVKLLERGTIATSGARVFTIASAADANPALLIRESSGFYQAFHSNGSTSVSSTLAVAPVVGNTVELLLRLFGDGSVDITQSVNSGASTSGSQSSALALATAWSGSLVWLNSAGTAGSYGYTDIQSFKIVAGVRGLAEMRTL